MIQLNLLPDVKLEYIKAQRARRLVMSISVLVTGVAVLILILLLGVNGLQKKHLKDLSRDIANENSELQRKPNIGRVLTVQNQLGSLTQLHDSNPAVSRLFDYLNQVTPASVAITSLQMDFTQNTATISGTSASLANVNQYIDTLKKSTFTTDSDDSAQPAFSNIVLSAFGLNTGAKDPSQAANYTVTLAYDKNIFDTTQKVKLTVPSSGTRTQVAQPTDLFQATSPSPATATGGGR
ncbi:MAG TPA: PilN domain-containing protein [Verrucomicrobiae bacterium]|nr:PilN domain-containing protein [Verrucomicrobiae bacterium]